MYGAEAGTLVRACGQLSSESSFQSVPHRPHTEQLPVRSKWACSCGVRGPALVQFPLLISSSLFSSWQGHPPGKALGKLEVLEVIVDRELWAVLG